VPEFNVGIRNFDIVLTLRNLHNIDPLGRAKLNAAAFKALNKNGRYAVVAHTRRHTQLERAEVWKRIDPVQMIKEVQLARFKLVDYSNLHYKLGDESRNEGGSKSMAGNTDRFTALFKKP
jgi:predicted methyltransferase